MASIIAPVRERLHVFNADVDGIAEFVEALAPEHTSIILRIGLSSVPLRTAFTAIPSELRDVVVLLPGYAPRVCLTPLGRQVYARILRSAMCHG